MMKQIFRNSKKMQSSLLLITGCVIALIWIFNPIPSLASFDKKIYISLIAALLWLLQYLLFPSEPLSPTLSKEQQEKLRQLQGRFAGAIQFFKKTKTIYKGKSLNLNKLPWYLFVGHYQAGKSSLLSNANVPYLLTKIKKTTPIDSCDWWATKDAVIVDVPSGFDKKMWDHFLQLIERYKKKQTVKGILIALPLAEFLIAPNKEKKKELILSTRQKILTLQQNFDKKIPIYFVLTKCDRIPGFIEFFSEALDEELSQSWGIHLPEPKGNESMLNVFIQRFNLLLKKINKQLIWRLHQERNSNLRPLIKDFPLHLERLKSSIGFFIKGLAIPDLALRGVYLTSATQPSDAEESQNTIVGGSQQVMKLLRNPIKPKAYFIQQFISHAILTCSYESPVKNKQPYFVFASAAGVILGVGLLFAYDFNQSMQKTQQIQTHLSEYKLLINHSNNVNDYLIKALPLLTSADSFKTHAQTSISPFFDFYSHKSLKTATLIHQEVLKTLVLPNIQKTFENYLQTSNMHEANELYSTFKAYLLLEQDHSNQIDFIVEKLKPLLPSSLDKKTHLALMGYVVEALKLPTPIQLNKKLIEQTQRQLQSIPSNELAWIILKNKNAQGFINVDEKINSSLFYFKKPHKIPQFYTANVFETFMTSEIKAAVKEATQGNTILGSFTTSAVDTDDLTEQLKTQYASEYTAIWEDVLNDLQVAEMKNLEQVDHLIAHVMENNSSLLNLLKIINHQTAFNLIMSKSTKLNDLNKLLLSAKTQNESALYRAFVSMRQLHQHLKAILNSGDIGKNAFLLSAERMQQSGNDSITELYITSSQISEPIKSWLQTIAEKSWFFLLQETANYIESAWQVNILTQYHSYRTAPEIDLQQFANLTGKQGLLDTFQETYFKPFINSFTQRWQWKVIDNQSLPFSQLALEQLQNANKLQTLSKFVLFSKGRTLTSVQNFQLPEKLGELS